MLSLPLDNGDILCINVRTSTRAKRLRLISGIKGVEAVVPIGYSDKHLQEFVNKKRAWIIKTSKHYDKLRLLAGNNDPSSATILYMGRKYRLHIVKDRLRSTIISDTLAIATFHVCDMRSYKREIELWYKEQTTKIISDRLPIISVQLGLHYNRYLVKNQKSRWGSCSKNRNLNFNLFLSAAPLEIIDYVIVHELCHIAEMNHSKKFWKLVEVADPKYREHREWLENHSAFIGVQGL